MSIKSTTTRHFTPRASTSLNVKFTKSEVSLVMSKGGCTESLAVKALTLNDGMVMDALMYVGDVKREEAEGMLGFGGDEGKGVDWEKEFGKLVSEGGGDSVRPIGNDGIEDVREERRVKRAVEKRKIEMDQLKKKFQGGEKDADWMPGREGMKDDDEPWFTG